MIREYMKPIVTSELGTTVVTWTSSAPEAHKDRRAVCFFFSCRVLLSRSMAFCTLLASARSMNDCNSSAVSFSPSATVKRVEQDGPQRQHLGQQSLLGGPRLPSIQFPQQHLTHPLADRAASGQRFQPRILPRSPSCRWISCGKPASPCAPPAPDSRAE